MSGPTMEQKAAVFDALVKEFQGKGRYVRSFRRVKEIRDGLTYAEAVVISEDIPIYEFIMRVNGHDDFEAAILGLLPKEE